MVDSQERRNYFRITDDLLLSYRELTADEKLSQIEGVETPLGFLAVLDEYDSQLEHVLSGMRTQEPRIAEALDLLNKKINLLASQTELGSQAVEQAMQAMRQVNISASGLAFFNDTALELGQLLRLDLRLERNGMHMAFFAKVVGCDSIVDVDQGRGYYLRLQFESLSQHDQELLIQHVVRRQGSQLRDKHNDAV